VGLLLAKTPNPDDYCLIRVLVLDLTSSYLVGGVTFKPMDADA